MRVLIVSEGVHERAGALENLLVKLGGDPEAFESERVANNKIHAFHGKGQGYFKKAVRWLLEAEQKEYDALVFLVDEDGSRERIKQIQDAQNTYISMFPRAMGVAIKTFDAWMLSDEKALTEVLGYNVDRQPNPEEFTNPKQVCLELLEKSSVQMKQREMYAGVASNIDVDILSDRCPKGFKPFAENVKKVFLS